MIPTSKPNVKVIQPVSRRADILRVGAYCRVSSKSEDQLNSYAAQIDYYTKMVSANPAWELVDIYADKGLTGTEMEHRDDLLRMIADCRKGKLDKILIKSFTRLARNTVDSLTIIRDLKLMGVSVRSERERFDTENMANEMLIMLWSNMAQEESNSISRNMRWSYKKRMQKGEFITCFAPYGYRLMDGKMLAIKETEADTIRWIFQQYLDGTSTAAIARSLDAVGAPTPYKSKSWYDTAVHYILKNEKYVGDTLAQKHFTTDTLPFKSYRNKGERDQYYIKNSHPAIISRDVFDKAQMLLKAKANKTVAQPGIYTLTKKLVCADCGSAFHRKVTVNGYVSWICCRHYKQKSLCDTPKVSEKAVYTAFMRMLRKLKQHADIILEPSLTQLHDLQAALQRDHTGIIALRQELAEAMGKAHTLSELRNKNLLDDATWQSYNNEIKARQFELRHKLRILLDNDGLNDSIGALEWLKQTIKAAQLDTGEFHSNVFEEIVEKAVINADGSICFILPGGVEITEQLCEVSI